VSVNGDRPFAHKVYGIGVSGKYDIATIFAIDTPKVRPQQIKCRDLTGCCVLREPKLNAIGAAYYLAASEFLASAMKYSIKYADAFLSKPSVNITRIESIRFILQPPNALYERLYPCARPMLVGRQTYSEYWTNVLVGHLRDVQKRICSTTAQLTSASNRPTQSRSTA
jgi:hypothetical protein